MPLRFKSAWLYGGGAAIWLATATYAVAWGAGFHAVFRVVVSAFAVSLGVFFWRAAKPLLLISPLYVLGCLFLIFYSWTPALFAATAVPSPGWGLGEKLVIAGVGSPAEALALQFAAFCFFASLIVYRVLSAIQRQQSIRPPMPAVDWRLFTIAASAALTLAFVEVAIRWVPALREATTSPVIRQATDGLPPLISLCLAVVGHAGSNASRRTTWLACLVVLSCVVLLLLSNLAEVPLAIGFAVLGTMASTSRFPDRRLALTIGCTAVTLLTITLLSVTYLRAQSPPRDTARAILLRFQEVIVDKAVLREGVPLGCLQAILSDGASAEESGGPLYYWAAIIPRFVWPKKPTLSLGSEYSVRYCGNRDAMKTHHSESITLIGEPLLHGGMAGLAVAQATLAILLGILTVVGNTGGIVPKIALTAILPWLIAFDQHFALYFGNVVKMSCYMAPFIAGFWWATSARRPGFASKGREEAA